MQDILLVSFGALFGANSRFIIYKEFEKLNLKKYYSILTKIKPGTPVNVMKVWDSDDSVKWLLVNVLCQNSYQFFYRRGWVEIRGT